MVSSSLTPDRMVVVDRPSPGFKLAAIALPVLGLAVAGFLGWQVLAPRSGSFRCDRETGRCEMQLGRKDWSVALAELAGARVTETHRHKVGTMYQLDVVLASGETRDIGRPTGDEETAAEYRAAAAAIEAFVQGQEPHLELAWTYRVGFGELQRLGLFAVFLLFAGGLMLALWSHRSCEVDRREGRVALRRSGPLRRRRTRTAALADVTGLRERVDRGRSSVELVLGEDRWTVIAGEPSSRPGLAEARRVLAEGLGHALERAA